jgi:hypothetical protein
MSVPGTMMGFAGSTGGRDAMRIVTGVDDGSWRTILVTDANPDQQTALEELGFPPDLVQRYPPGTRYFDRAVANLRQVVDRMVRQNAPQAPADWSQAFRDLLPRADQARIPLVVVGSVALAIRGVDVRPGDIDVLTTEEGADALAESYQDALVVPLATIEGFGRFGRAFTGMRVEWLGNPARAQEGPWPLAAAAWSVASPFEEVWWEGRFLRVPSLELQRQVDVHRQRPDRVAAIDQYRRTAPTNGPPGPPR